MLYLRAEGFAIGGRCPQGVTPGKYSVVKLGTRKGFRTPLLGPLAPVLRPSALRTQPGTPDWPPLSTSKLTNRSSSRSQELGTMRFVQCSLCDCFGESRHPFLDARNPILPFSKSQLCITRFPVPKAQRLAKLIRCPSMALLLKARSVILRDPAVVLEVDHWLTR